MEIQFGIFEIQLGNLIISVLMDLFLLFIAGLS